MHLEVSRVDSAATGAELRDTVMEACVSPGCSLEGMVLKLKLQYFGHLMEELTHWKRL